MNFEVREKKLDGLSPRKRMPFDRVVYIIDKDSSGIGMGVKYSLRSEKVEIADPDGRIVYFNILCREDREKYGGPFIFTTYQYCEKEYRRKGAASMAQNYIDDTYENFKYGYTRFTADGLAQHRAYTERRKQAGKPIREEYGKERKK